MTKDEKVIRLNGHFYSFESIERTIKAFSGVCSAEVLNKDYEIRISTKLEKQDIEETALEFANYCLGIMR